MTSRTHCDARLLLGELAVLLLGGSRLGNLHREAVKLVLRAIVLDRGTRTPENGLHRGGDCSRQLLQLEPQQPTPAILFQQPLPAAAEQSAQYRA